MINFRLLFPSKSEKKYNITKKDYFIQWNIDDNGKIELEFIIS